MTLGQRIERRRKEVGISQAELARRVGIRQSTMSSLINGDSRSSRSIVEIAQHLKTTPAYLKGIIDDPDEGAPVPAPQAVGQSILMPVVLPSENALAAMFEGLLEVIDRSAPVDEVARELAQLLPTGLSQLRGLLIEGTAVAALAPSEEGAEALATSDPEPPR